MSNHKHIPTGMTVIPLQSSPSRVGVAATALAVCQAASTISEADRDATNHGLNDVELAVCRETGVSPEAYREANPVTPVVTSHSTATYGLSEAELAVCRETGVTPEAYRKANSVGTSGAGRVTDTQGLSEAELAVCRRMGLSAEPFRKANQGHGSGQELEALITEGVRDGRIAGPATAAWLRQQGLAACRSHLDSFPSAEAARHGLSEAELAICRRMELDPAAYRRSKFGDA